MFFIAMEEKLVLPAVRSNNQLVALPAALQGLQVAALQRQGADSLSRGWLCVCACSILSATVTNVLPSADRQHGKK